MLPAWRFKQDPGGALICATRRTTQGKAARLSLKNYNLRCPDADRATRRRAKLRAAGGLQATEMNPSTGSGQVGE